MSNGGREDQNLLAAEQDALFATRAQRERCRCGEVHCDCDGVTPAVVARMKGYLAAHPGHQFAIDEEAGIVAVITHDPAGLGQPTVLRWAEDLAALLDAVGAPDASELS